VKRWSLAEYDEEDSEVALSTVPFKISLAELYHKV
jgi:hypothetical protein